MSAKFTGQLAKRIEPRYANHLLPPEQLNPILERHFKEDWGKILLLCERYGVSVDTDMFFSLSLALAREFVPGFQEKKRTGRRSKWESLRLGLLVVELEKLREEGNHSVRSAAQMLASREPWKSFVKTREKGDLLGDPGGALKKQYAIACKSKSVDYNRTHFANLRDAYGDEGWESYLQEQFDRE